jgi:hypothetical protein
MSQVVTIVGRERIMAMLDQLAGAESRKVLGQAMKDLAQPQLKIAKKLTPVVTGRLRASLGAPRLAARAPGGDQAEAVASAGACSGRSISST